MNDTPPRRPSRALAAIAAEDGTILGLYLVLLAVFTGLSAHFALATALVWAGSLYLPFYIYALLRRSHAEASFGLTVPELWSQALMGFILGSMLQALAVYVLLRFAVPNFIADQIASTIATLDALGTPEATALSQTLVELRQTNGIPAATDVVANLIVFNTFAGAVMGLADAIILKARYMNHARRARFTSSHPNICQNND